MKNLTNINAETVQAAVDAAEQAIASGQSVAFSGGGTDLLQQIKDGTEQPEVLINLRTVNDGGYIQENADATSIGGLVTLDALSADTRIASNYPVLAQAAASVGTPQIRNVATLAGNITQRPWCWYYRNGFQCFKAGGDRCYSVSGENSQHAIFGGGPSFIVHPSDIAPALSVLEAVFTVRGAGSNQNIPVEEFFLLPSQDPSRENVLRPGELLSEVHLPRPAANWVSTYYKVMDRAAWTHAEVSVAVVLELAGSEITGARLALGGVAPIPWRLSAVEGYLVGEALTESVAAEAGTLAVNGAQPLAKNRHKIPMVSAAVERALLSLA